MNVLFISNDPTIFDSTSPTRERMRSYARAIGGELHIVSRARPGAQDEQDGALFLHPVVASKLFRLFALTTRARQVLAASDIAVVSAQDPFEHGFVALRAVKGTKARLHIQVHTDFLSPWFVRSGNLRSPQVRMPFLNRYRCLLAERVLPRADGIRVVSERIKTSLLTHFGTRIGEPTVIPVAVDTTSPAAVPLPEHPFKFTLIAVGRLEPEKRFEDILVAMQQVVLHYPMVGLLIAGEGRERVALETRARTLGLEGSVIFLGDRPDARGLMASANAFIQASAYEGYGRTLIEAALARVPIITTDVGIVGEVFKGYEDVLAVPVADPTALGNAIVGVIEDVAIRLQLPPRAEAAARAHLATVGDIPERIAADLARVATRL